MFQITVVCLIRCIDLAICDCTGSTCCGQDDAEDVIEIEITPEPVEEKPEEQKPNKACHCESFKIPSKKEPKSELPPLFKDLKPFVSKPSTANQLFGGSSLKSSTL